MLFPGTAFAEESVNAQRTLGRRGDGEVSVRGDDISRHFKDA